MKAEQRPIRNARWDYTDPLNQYVTHFKVSVLMPETEHPYCTVLVTVGRQTFRCMSVATAMNLVVIPEKDLERLRDGEKIANQMADQMEHDLRRLMELRRLPPGVGLIRTDTGERIMEDKARYIAEAERIVKGGNNAS